MNLMRGCVEVQLFRHPNYFFYFFFVHLSHMEREDFEDVVLGDSDGDGNNSPDDFEDIKYAEENDPYRTKRCPCPCHQEMITKRNRDGIRHCYNCCLKVHPTSHFSFSFSFLIVCILQRENVCVCVCVCFLFVYVCKCVCLSLCVHASFWMCIRMCVYLLRKCVHGSACLHVCGFGLFTRLWKLQIL